jgi:pimeloyl-ACP methyl ester carboxylesterase
MSVFSWLADRLILCPSNHAIDPENRRQVFIETPGGRAEAWVLPKPPGDRETSTSITVIKFPGTGGRAERGGLHPVEVWPDIAAEVWTINQLGYGGSDGPATIQSFPATASAVYEFLRQQHPGNPVLVVGNSLGCISALYLAGRRPVSAVLLRNPPPISQMIRMRPRYNWWNFGMSKLIANQVPEELDAVANAASSTAPCLFVQSERDRVVPRQYQDLIVNQYAGRHRVFMIPDADHHHPVAEELQEPYFESLYWLRDQLAESADLA